MRHARSIAGISLLVVVLLLTHAYLAQTVMFASLYLLPLFSMQIPFTVGVDVTWYPPNASWINDLAQVMNGSGTNGFVFTSSELPSGVRYGTYNWCNMPHVRREEYPVASSDYVLKYVEVIHRHHKRTPYAANTFPRESYRWSCSDEGLSYYGSPLNPTGNSSTPTYWSVYTSANNPFAPTGFNGTCQFPQITRGGLDDSFQHGRDLWGVYHTLLNFLPADAAQRGLATYRVTNNVITSQVASMMVSGMQQSSAPNSFPLSIQPASIDSLEPAYPCPSATTLYASFGPGSTSPRWTAHLRASAPLFAALDAISNVPRASTDWHESWDHYYDNLSARLCHAKALPCKSPARQPCVTDAQAAQVFRLGQYEYSLIYRDAPQSLAAAVASYGVWVAELAANLRSAAGMAASTSPSTSDPNPNPDSHGNSNSNADATATAPLYRHNVAHDGSVSRLLAILQVDVMVWPGMGAELVFELFSQPSVPAAWFVRVLFGGQVLRSSSPSLGRMEMVPLERVLAYFDALVGVGAGKVVGLCAGERY